MGWGDLADAPFELVTHMGNTTRCKPDATYYLEQLQVMGLDPHEVLMVGNDPKRDFPSPACGAILFGGRGPMTVRRLLGVRRRLLLRR